MILGASYQTDNARSRLDDHLNAALSVSNVAILHNVDSMSFDAAQILYKYVNSM